MNERGSQWWLSRGEQIEVLKTRRKASQLNPNPSAQEDLPTYYVSRCTALKTRREQQYFYFFWVLGFLPFSAWFTWLTRVDEKNNWPSDSRSLTRTLTTQVKPAEGKKSVQNYSVVLNYRPTDRPSVRLRERSTYYSSPRTMTCWTRQSGQGELNKEGRKKRTIRCSLLSFRTEKASQTSSLGRKKKLTKKFLFITENKAVTASPAVCHRLYVAALEGVSQMPPAGPRSGFWPSHRLEEEKP